MDSTNKSKPPSTATNTTKTGKDSSQKQTPKQNAKELTELAAKIDETDEMKLKMLAALDKPEPDDLLYPAELNAHLIDQLKVMTCENNELRKCVFTKDQDIKELNKTVSDLNTRIRDMISGSGPAISSKSAGIISAKLTDLCKQNRHLVAEVEGYKTKNAALQRKIMQIEIMDKEHIKDETCHCKDEPYDPRPEELKELNKQLSLVNKRLYESKNRNLELKSDILLATKILQQEMGEKFTSLKELQNDLAGWKGRAEQIIKLKARISELEEKLAGGKPEYRGKPNVKPQSEIIRELEAKRKKEVDSAMKELNALREENHELKKKLDGAKCRIRNLECDSINIRQKMQTFAEKSNADDMLVNEQRAQIKTLEQYYQEILKENTATMAKMTSEIAEYQKFNSNTDAKIDAMRKQSTEKAVKIEELRAQLLRYEECSLQSVFFTPMKTATDNEIKKLSDLVITLNDRLDDERRKWDELETNHMKLREKKRRLERKLNVLEDEIKNLQKEPKRVVKSSKTSLTKENTFDSFGQGIAKRISSVTTGAAVERPSDYSSESQTDYEPIEKEDVKFKLELAEEKLKIMEDKLKMIEEEKQYDYNHLTDMIQTSKQLFNEALAVLQREKCLCF